MKNNASHIIVFFFIFIAQTKQGTIHEYFTELFPRDVVPTEYTAYKLLKKNPVPANYLAIPWVTLINTRQLKKVTELNFKIPGGFTICQHIKYADIIPLLKEIGIDTLFTPHATKEEECLNGIHIVPFPHYPINGTAPAHKKSIFYSFVGASRTHHTRKQICQMSHPQNTSIIERNNWHFFTHKKETFTQEYKNVLAQSRFSLCPRGTGPSTIRFWESLQAGAIPILISDNTVLPKHIEWDFIIQVPESQVSNIPFILKSVPAEKEDYMRTKCLTYYKEYIAQENFITTIYLYYGDIQ